MSTTLQPLPNPFMPSQANPNSGRPSRFAVQPAVVACLICLVLGMAVVTWRAKARANDARARASLEALARGSAVELQFSQVVSAAEVLGALARQHGGAIPDFQKVATELLAARPGLASLELQPGGVVSDIVPRAPNARVIGFNVLNNPTYRPGASAAIQRRALTVSGPLALYSGEPGIVARVPVFLRGRDGRDVFWGLVAASLRLSDALNRAQVNGLITHGYDYAFLVPASGREKGVTVAVHGALSAQSAVQQPVRANDLEFRLLLQPRGGWTSKTKLVLETLGVLVLSGLICLLANLLEGRRALEAELGDANQRLARETEERKRAQEDCHRAKDEAAATQAEISQAQSALQSSREQEVRLTIAVCTAEAATQAAQAELDQARTALQQAEQTITSLQSRLRAAARAKKEIEAAPQPAPQPDPPAVADVPVPADTAPLLAEPGTDPSLQPLPSAPPAAPASSESEPMPAPVASPEPEPSAPPTIVEMAPTETAPPSEPPAEAKPDRALRRKKARLGQVEETREEPSVLPEASNVSPSSSEPALEPIPAPVASLEPEPSAPPAAVETPPTETGLPSEPSAEQKPIRTPRRKKARPDPQMDFFAPRPASGPVPAAPPAEAPAEAPADEAPSLPPSAAAEPDGPEQASADDPEHIPVAAKPKEVKPARPLPARPPLDLAQLRKAINLILPLFTGRDPGARDCLKDNRTTFRSAFAPEVYQEFEQSVKSSDFDAALEHLKKAAKRHGIPV